MYRIWDLMTNNTNLFFRYFSSINLSHLDLETIYPNLFFLDSFLINVSHLDYKINHSILSLMDFFLITVSLLDLLINLPNLVLRDLSNPIIHTSRHSIHNTVPFLFVLYSIQKIFLINFYDICNI